MDGILLVCEGDTWRRPTQVEKVVIGLRNMVHDIGSGRLQVVGDRLTVETTPLTWVQKIIRLFYKPKEQRLHVVLKGLSTFLIENREEILGGTTYFDKELLCRLCNRIGRHTTAWKDVADAYELITIRCSDGQILADPTTFADVHYFSANSRSTMSSFESKAIGLLNDSTLQLRALADLKKGKAISNLGAADWLKLIELADYLILDDQLKRKIEKQAVGYAYNTYKHAKAGWQKEPIIRGDIPMLRLLATLRRLPVPCINDQLFPLFSNPARRRGVAWSMGAMAEEGNLLLLKVLIGDSPLAKGLLNAKTLDGLTAYQLATRGGHTDCANWLRSV